MAVFEDPSGCAAFPQLSTDNTCRLIVQCADVTLQLAGDRTVSGIFCAKDVDGTAFADWCGKPFEALVSTDSQPKVLMLLEDNAASEEFEGRWRHLNLVGGDGAEVPLLLKCFRFTEGESDVILVCGRDLRPMVDVQAQFHQQLINLERKIQVLEAETQKG